MTKNVLFVIYISSQTLEQKYRNWDSVAKTITYTAVILTRFLAAALNVFGKKFECLLKMRVIAQKRLLLLFFCSVCVKNV